MPVSIRQVINTVAAEFSITRDELCGDSRCAKIAHPRALAIMLARDLTGASYPQIGRAFNRHHSSCVSAVRRAHNLIDAFPHYYDKIEAVKQALKNQL
jgi:chromosomal replication initiator protein